MNTETVAGVKEFDKARRDRDQQQANSHKQKVSFSLPYIRKWQRGDTDISPTDTDISPSDTDISPDTSKT